MAKKKTKRDPYDELDENGRWVSEKTRILGAIRRSFRLSPQMKIVLEKARVELPPKIKKDGTPGKRNQVRYRCASCKQLFPQKYVQVDHIEPVVDLWRKLQDMSYDEIVRKIHCKVDNLQVLCSTPKKLNDGKDSCHRTKTNEENFIRKYLFSQHEDYSKIKKREINKLIKEAKKLYKEKLTKKKTKRKRSSRRK